MKTFRRLYRGWMIFAEKWGAVMTTLLFAVGYLTVFSLFSPFLRRKDPLHLKKRDGEKSFWIDRPHAVASRESLRRLG